MGFERVSFLFVLDKGTGLNKRALNKPFGSFDKPVSSLHDDTTQTHLVVHLILCISHLFQIMYPIMNSPKTQKPLLGKNHDLNVDAVDDVTFLEYCLIEFCSDH